MDFGMLRECQNCHLHTYTNGIKDFIHIAISLVLIQTTTQVTKNTTWLHGAYIPGEQFYDPSTLSL